MDDKNPIAGWAGEEGGVYLCPLAGWQTGNHPKYGVATQIMYYANAVNLQSDKPSALQVLMSAEHAIELGEELIRQGREALGDAAWTH